MVAMMDSCSVATRVGLKDTMMVDQWAVRSVDSLELHWDQRKAVRSGLLWSNQLVSSKVDLKASRWDH